MSPEEHDGETPERLREIAADVMVAAARDTYELDVMIAESTDDGLCAEDVDAVRELIKTATVTVEWPEIAIEQPGADR